MRQLELVANWHSSWLTKEHGLPWQLVTLSSWKRLPLNAVGEVRGGEALDMLQAMNTGHDGSLTTIHANSPVMRWHGSRRWC